MVRTYSSTRGNGFVSAPRRSIVTGGGGFLGRRIVELLRARGDDVRVVTRRHDAGIAALGVSQFTADVRDPAAVSTAMADADVVFHVAGRTAVWGSPESFWSVNADGTRVVLDAARQGRVPRFIFTSTPSVVGYARDITNGKPDLPYAPVHDSAYAASKCAAERLVLDANDADIATIALRPHLIFGPGDPHVMPRVLERAARGRLRIVGDGQNRVDLTYVDNAAWAHLDAADALTGPGAPCAGKAYFISNGEPVVFWEWLNQILDELDLPLVSRSISYRAAHHAGVVLDTVWRALRLRGEPPITRFLAAGLARSHWYDMEPARRELGYRVRVPMDEATRRTVEWLAGLVDARELRGRAAIRRPPISKERPDYYITPTHDFTQYTRDYEEKYWSRDTAFDWQQDVPGNLGAQVSSLSQEAFSTLAAGALTLVLGTLRYTIGEVRYGGLPSDEDALKAIRGIVPFDRLAIDEALRAVEPLEALSQPLAQLRDQLIILQRHELEARERQRLGLFKRGTTVRQAESAAERSEQAKELAELAARRVEIERALERTQRQDKAERRRLQAEIRRQLGAIAPHVLADLEATRGLVRDALRQDPIPCDERLRDLVWKRQVRALKDIANHALVVEQSAIAPLTMGIIHYKRRREIQEAMTTFVNDEAKHSAVFRRYMADKLGAKERIPDNIIKSGDRYMWLARFLPSGGIFLANIVEAIGAAYLGFFAEEAHMPEPLFRSICQTIALRDERRHMDLCAATYNELYRTGSRWEQLRNRAAFRAMMKAAYGDKTTDHPLIQACCSFGVDAAQPYRHVASGLSQQLTRVGLYVTPDEVLTFMNFSASSD